MAVRFASLQPLAPCLDLRLLLRLTRLPSADNGG